MTLQKAYLGAYGGPREGWWLSVDEVPLQCQHGHHVQRYLAHKKHPPS